MAADPPMSRQDSATGGVAAGSTGAEEDRGANRDSSGSGNSGGCRDAILGRANVWARERAARDDKGLTMDPPVHDGKTGRAARRGAKGEEEDVRLCYGTVWEGGGGKRRGGGYKVGEYDTSEYDTSEYNVSEYRSVYD
jgi:hypothetical protein